MVRRNAYQKFLTIAIVAAVAAPFALSEAAQAAPTPTFTRKTMSATVSGTNVTATTSVQASSETTAQYAGICVRDASENIWDFDKQTNLTITTSGTTLSGPKKTFNAGTYTYFVCLSVGNTWYQAGKSQTFTVGNATTAPSGSSYGDNALEHWSNAVANRNSKPATWVAWGDSFTEGQGASDKKYRWIDRALGSLRGTYPTTGVTGGVGYLPAFYATYGPDSTWMPFSSASDGNHSWEYWGGSLGNRIVSMQADGSETFTVTGTSVDILYAEGAGDGTFSYKVSVKATGEVKAADKVETPGSYNPSKTRHVELPRISGIPATYDVKIAGVSGTSYFEGLMVYNGDENKGIRLYDAAHSGATTDQFKSSMWDQAEITAAAKADLVTIELGANDYLHGSQTPAGVTANLRDMIESIRSTASARSTHQPSIAVVIPWNFSASGTKNGYTWNDFAGAIRNVAAADSSVALLDLTSIGSPAGNPGGLYAPDGLHPSDSGHAAISAAATSFLD